LIFLFVKSFFNISMKYFALFVLFFFLWFYSMLCIFPGTIKKFFWMA